MDFHLKIIVKLIIFQTISNIYELGTGFKSNLEDIVIALMREIFSLNYEEFVSIWLKIITKLVFRNNLEIEIVDFVCQEIGKSLEIWFYLNIL